MLKLIDRARARFPSSDTFKITDSLIKEIQTELLAFRANPVRIATKLGVPVALVRFISNETPSGTSDFTVHSTDGWGRTELRDFVVTRKAAIGDWSPEDKALLEGIRDAYDNGTHELAQGRDGNFIIQYAFPRNKKAKRTYRYFKIEEE